MKYDDLEMFREYLYSQVQNTNTARKYYGAVVKLFRDVDIRKDIKQLSGDFYEEKIPVLFKTRNEVSAVKNGLRYFRDYLNTEKGATGGMAVARTGRTVPVPAGTVLPEDEFYHGINRKKRNRSVKPKKILYLDEICRKVNQIRDEKTRYAFRLALVSGLRVSELAGIDADKITFDNGLIYVNVTNGKGGSNGVVECLPDHYLYARLQQYAKEHPEGRLFYCESTLRKRAWELGLECHDFRRIFAVTKRNSLKKIMPVEEANEKVKESLRHKRFSTTKRYLFNRKLVVGQRRVERA